MSGDGLLCEPALGETRNPENGGPANRFESSLSPRLTPVLARAFETAALRLACARRGQALKRSAKGFGSCPTEIHCPRRVFSSALRRLLADAFGTPSTSGSRPRSALSPHRRRPRWLWGRRGSTLTRSERASSRALVSWAAAGSKGLRSASKAALLRP